MYTEEQIVKVLGCTVDQLRSQNAKNAAQLALMLHKAVTTGRKVNNFTAEQFEFVYGAANFRFIIRLHRLLH